MCQHNLPCSIVYAHCLLPGRAFASLYVLLFLEKEAEIGGRDKAPGKTCTDPEGRAGSGNHKAIGFLSNTGPDPLENPKATKPTYNVEPLSARQQNAIYDGPLFVVYGSSPPPPHHLKKGGPPLSKLSGSAHEK